MTRIIIVFLVVAVCHCSSMAQTIPREAQITTAEYFVGADPGIGRGTPITVSNPSTSVTLGLYNLSLQANAAVFIRFKNSNGKWSSPRAIRFPGTGLNRDALVMYAEHFVGSDPGRGKATSISITQGPKPSLNLSSLGLQSGQKLYLRVRDADNRWSRPVALSYPARFIRRAEIVIGSNPSSTPFGTGIAMAASDGAFKNPHEPLSATITTWNRRDTIWVRAQSSDHLWSLPLGDNQIARPGPTLQSLSPTKAGRGSRINVTLNGSNFISESTVSFGQDITVVSVTLKSVTQLVANISISSTATVGQRNVSVTNPTPGGGTASLTNAFTIDTSPAVTVESETRLIPADFALSQNYPNPFNPSTRIQYALPTPSYVKLEILNLLGQRVVELVNGEIDAGYHQAEWQAQSGVASAIYFYRIEGVALDNSGRRPSAGSGQRFVETKKMLFIQ